MKKSKGFTLIELTVVISIIGILAGIILVDVNKARDKAVDAVTRLDLSDLRTAAEMYYSDKGSYDGFANKKGVAGANSDCKNGSDDWKRICQHIKNVNPTSNPKGYSGVEYWCAQANLKQGETWCTDYKGNSKDTVCTSGKNSSGHTIYYCK